jgi:tetratricopeptide (TPR) repeat protein
VAYANRGVARVRGGDVAGAITDYTQALRLNPGDPEVYFNRGDAQVLAGDHASAIADFTRAIDASPGFARAIFNRGTVHMRVGNRRDALADWRAAIALERDPWTKAGMERSASLDASETMPLVAATTLPAGASPAPPSFVAAPATPRVVAAAEASAPLTAAPPSVAPPSVRPPSVAPPSTAAAPALPAIPAEDLDARTLANRALSRELDGDHPGAMADLGAAIVKESDPVRRASMQHLLQLLQTSQ